MWDACYYLPCLSELNISESGTLEAAFATNILGSTNVNISGSTIQTSQVAPLQTLEGVPLQLIQGPHLENTISGRYE